MFKRILATTDFSEGAEAAWRAATSLAEAYRAQLVLLHVQSPLPVYGFSEGALADLQRIYREQRDWVDARLGELVTRARADGLEAVAHIRTGTPADAIVETARDEKADLLVVGTHGRTGLNRLILGSVAERVVRLAPCPVLTVKARDERRDKKAA